MITMYDLIIVGSGVSGMAAAIYAGRFDMKTLVIGDRPGGTITLTHLVENYPGYTSLSGLELATHFQDHVNSVGVEMKTGSVESITRENEKGCFKLKAGEESYHSKTVLLATGTEHRKLNVKGEAELTNKGVSYCATCDGPLFKNKDLVIVGGGDSAVKESLLLAKYGKSVKIIYRGAEIRPEPINKRRMEATTNIEVMTKSNIIEIVGKDRVGKVILDTGQEIECQGVFIEIGRTPLTDLAKKIDVGLNQKGEIIINKMSETNVKGFLAAGDCTNTDWKQAVVGVAEGCLAAYSAYEYVSKNTIECV